MALLFYNKRKNKSKMELRNISFNVNSRVFKGEWKDPLDVYSPLSEKVCSYLLEFTHEKTKESEISIIGYDPCITLLFREKEVTLIKGEDSIIIRKHAVSFLKDLLSGIKLEGDTDLLPFTGGLVGFFGYEFVKNIEDISIPSCDSMDIPDAILTISKRYIVFDHKRKNITALAISTNDKDISHQSFKASELFHGIEKIIINSNNRPWSKDKIRLKDLRTDLSKEDFKAIVRRAKAYIKSGEAIQVVLSNRFSWSFTGNLLQIYRNIRKINPSPYMFYMNFGYIKLAGASPEKLVSLKSRVAELCPIAGTRPRGKNIHEDMRLEQELIHDPKERAEHIMLVDLGRNDLGRISIPGSVRVSEFMEIYRFSHVMHIVSRIEAILREDKDSIDLICATFPAGTVTGAPKIRAMEIIGELEGTFRGPYAGAVGYISFDGSMNFCITIRSLYVAGDRLFLQAGAGIVFDSIPEKEHQEILNKANAIFQAVGSEIIT